VAKSQGRVESNRRIDADVVRFYIKCALLCAFNAQRSHLKYIVTGYSTGTDIRTVILLVCLI
jgi:hypothetical protein